MATLSEDLRPKHGSMSEAIRIQSRVIKALIMRELHTRYGRENIGYLWLILEPMLLAMVIGLVHAKGTRTHFGDVQPVPLALIGYCNFMLFRGVFNRGEGAIEQNLPLMYHRTVKPLDVLVSRALLETAGTWVSFAILMGSALALGMTHWPARPAWLILGMFMMLWFAFGASLVIAGLTYDRRVLGRLVHPFSYVMMPLSGAFFVMAMLPKQLRDMFLWVPLAHIFEILRYGWFYSATNRYIDMSYLLGWQIMLTLLGLILLSGARKRIHMA